MDFASLFARVCWPKAARHEFQSEAGGDHMWPELTKPRAEDVGQLWCNDILLKELIDAHFHVRPLRAAEWRNDNDPVVNLI